MTDEFKSLQRLLRLKRHEHPEDMDAFTADLIAKMHVRQREDYLKQSSWNVFWDRVTTWFESQSTPKVALATVAAAVLVIGGVSLLGAGSSGRSGLVDGERVQSGHDDSGGFQMPASFSTSPLFGSDLIQSPEGHRISPELLSMHFGGGYADEAWQAATGELLRDRMIPPFEVMPDITFKFAPEPEDEKK